MLYSLVCEGPCNPEIGMLDALVKVQRDQEKRALPELSSQTLVRLRALKHTPHVALTTYENVCACTICGTTRRF